MRFRQYIAYSEKKRNFSFSAISRNEMLRFRNFAFSDRFERFRRKSGVKLRVFGESAELN